METNPHSKQDREDDLEYYQERAAILEYEAGYTREEAEKAAREMMIARRQQPGKNVHSAHE